MAAVAARARFDAVGLLDTTATTSNNMCGVAVLSCTDCSGSSTSSDITDPGSPFSSASSHSEDSAASQQSAKMPPTQSAHHPPWSWTEENNPPLKRPTASAGGQAERGAASFPKRLKTTTAEEDAPGTNNTKRKKKSEQSKQQQQSPTCLSVKTVKNTTTNHHHHHHQVVTASALPNNNNLIHNNNHNHHKSVNTAQMPTAISNIIESSKPSPNRNINNNNNNSSHSNALLSGRLKGGSNAKIISGVKTNTAVKKSEIVIAPRLMQQGKITEYFKSQMKSNGIRKELSNIALKATSPLDKFVAIVDETRQKIGANAKVTRKIEVRKIVTTPSARSRKPSPISTPRKILPAPSKIPEKISVNNVSAVPNINGMNNFHPVTLTAVTFPPNLTYIHAKAPKPPDHTAAANIYVPHFAAITSDKISTIPIVNRTPPCLNVIQPIQKFTAINNFNNCVKLNATVVPIVKLNALPAQHRVNGSNFNVFHHHQQSFETASPTVLSAKQSVNVTNVNAASGIPQKVNNNTAIANPPSATTTTTSSNNNSSNHSNSDNNSSSSSNSDHNHHHSNGTSEQILRICRSDEPATPDSDSGISSTRDVLEVSVGEPVTADESQKSPILSQPKTIRFPAKQQESSETKEKGSHSNDSSACHWSKCHALFDTSGALLEHLQVEHVISQATQEQYVCLWLGCKVHGRTSCSRSWLERHVLAHAGTKPFRCIVDGCGMRFNSQLSLERHVNNHFNTDGTQNSANKKTVENGSAKLFKRNGKKIRFRRQPWSARMFDFIDSGIMEGLQYRLLTMTARRTTEQFETVAGDAVTVHSQVLARRIEPDGSRKLLLRWHPEDIVPDEWVDETDYTAKKNVPIPKLEASAKNVLKPLLFPQEEATRTRQKHRRKPVTSTNNGSGRTT